VVCPHEPLLKLGVPWVKKVEDYCNSQLLKVACSRNDYCRLRVCVFEISFLKVTELYCLRLEGGYQVHGAILQLGSVRLV
jgi:hypothetical protein